MKPNHRAWKSLLQPFEAQQWDACTRIVRAWVDDDPYDMTSRALLASLYSRAGSPELARLQYEKLLPMAVGQGDMLWALCTQKRLDELQGKSSESNARYHAMYEWFRYLVPDTGKSRRRQQQGLSASALIGLPDDVFSGSAVRATMHDLGLSSRTVSVVDGMLWFVYYGRVQWRGIDARGDIVERVADAGEPIFVRATESAEALDLVPEIPTECIALEPALAGPLGLAMSTPPTILPRPDPELEPTLAVGAPHERRRRTRVAVALESKIAFLGEIGTLVSPLHGKLVDLSPGGLGVTFPAAQLRQARGVFADAILPVQLSLRGSGDPIELAARVAWIRKGSSAEGGEARMGLEFISMSPENRSRLIYILDEAARSGVSF
jgi:hypothetical protein